MRSIRRVNDDGETEKLCSRCEEWWPADTEFFDRDKRNVDGLHGWCKACVIEYKREAGLIPEPRQPIVGALELVEGGD